MFCPSCQNTLRERERDGVLLDICPGCNGVWLDRGELEKLTRGERSYYRRDDDDDDDDDDDWKRRGQSYDARPPAYEGAPRNGYDGAPRYDDRRPDDRRPDDRPYDDRSRGDDRYRGVDDRYRQQGGYAQPKKKKGFLENILGNLSENVGPGGGAMDD